MVIDNIPYREGESNSWKLDIAIPQGKDSLKPFPAIVIVHGGGWQFGFKQAPIYRALLMDYALQGYLTISVEYRMIDEAPFPACIQDVKCAVRWLKAHAGKYKIDTNKIGAFGHSAGAHLVMMLAMSSSNKELKGDGGWNEYSSKITSVVGGSTPTQMIEHFGDSIAWWPEGYISANIPPTLLIHGIADEVVPIEPVDEFVEQLKQAGAKDINYLRIEGGKHAVAYELNLDITRPAMDEFFEKTLKK